MRRLLDRFAPGFLKPLVDRVMDSPLGSRFARGAFWSLIGAVAARFLGLASAVLVAKLIGKVSYGEFGVVAGTLVLLSGFSGIGLERAATKYVAEFRNSAPDRAGAVIGLTLYISAGVGAAFALALFGAAPWVAGALAAPHLAPALRATGVAILFNALGNAQTGVLTGLEAFKRIGQLGIFDGVLAVPLVAGGAYLGGVLGAVLGLGARSALTCVARHIVLIREARASGIEMTRRNIWSERRIITDFGLPKLLSSGTVLSSNWLARALLVNQPGGYAEMAVYDAADRWGKLTLFIPGRLGAPVLPILADLYGKGERRQYLQVLKYHFLFSMGFAVLAAGGVAALSVPLMTLFGSGFAEGSRVLVMLCGVMVLGQASMTVGTVNQSIGAVWFGFGMNLLWAAGFVGAVLHFRSQGAMGLAAAGLLVYPVFLVFCGVYLYYRLYIRWHDE